jgi:protein O-mannosyl-transferase
VLVYLGALGNPLVYDDVATIVENPSLRRPLHWPFVFVFNRFRPVVNVSYAFDTVLWDGDPFGYHLTSVLLHALAAALLFLLARALIADAAGKDTAEAPGRTGRAAAPLVAATLFAVHPLMTEAVGYVSARPEVLCAVFVFASLLAARVAMRGQPRWWVPAVAAWALGLGSRENAAMVPVLWLAYDRLLAPGDAPARRRRLWRLHVPAIALVVAAGAFRVGAFLRDEAGALPREVWRHFLTELPIFWRYLGLLLWPADQSLVHPAQRVASAFDPLVLVAAAGMVALAVAAWIVRRRWPVEVFALLWFPLLLAPSSSFIPLAELMAEHRAYLASAGIFLLAGSGFGRLLAWWQRTEKRPLRAPQVAFAVLAALLAVATMARNRIWEDPVTLWRDAATKAPLTWAPHFALGDALRDRDGCAAALAVYRRAVVLWPEDNRARINLGICLAQTEQYEAAVRTFDAALVVDPGSAAAHTNLGWLANRGGEPELARQHFRAALAREPRNAVALINLATLSETVFRDPAEALRLCRELAAAYPDAPAAHACIARNEQRLGAGQ